MKWTWIVCGGGVLGAYAFGAEAEPIISAPTATVKGRAPQVTNISVVNETEPGRAPAAGHTLRAQAAATDPDGDTVLDPLDYRWLLESTEVGTQATYVTTAADAGQTLTVEVTAHTDPAITDPASGMATTTVAVAANSAPTVSDLSVSGSPTVGATLTANYIYADADGDPQGDSTFRWLRADTATGTKTVINGATSNTYTPVAADHGGFLFFEVTPKSASGTPNVGTAVQSAASAEIDLWGFLKPDTVVRTWGPADSFCNSKGARLPTLGELQQLFVNATSSPTWYPNSGYIANSEMCSIYGWPFNGQCGGSITNYYWSSTPDDTGHYGVDLTRGYGFGNSDSSSRQVACVR